ncbi:hypothetical protein J3R30DRAFT_3702892 [Lentinula aciculospora]|uniref:Bromo domain-containing protein n=1 Tax=Lentinula aciculospora TaxID=153920 RepID=A0A9W9DNL6_9AGAR|nr:hypothetical protein J3R30DRAFT_3702892 [Lentinula aciculospora]
MGGPSLTKLDCLILAQSVYELGAAAWPAVAKLLSKHPLLQHPKSFFTAQSCETLYRKLRIDASLEIIEADNERHSPLNRKLAQIHYQARILELRELISVEEQKFKKVLSEIEELKNNSGSGSSPIKEAKADVEDFTSDLSGISSTSSPGKIEPSNQDTEDNSANVSKSSHHPNPDLADETTATKDESKEEMEEVESLTISPDQTTPISRHRLLEDDAPQQSIIEATIDAEDEVSRSSQALTPHEWTIEPEQDHVEVVDEEGATSGDEPLQRARRAKAAKRQRKASTPLPTRTGRRLRRTSVLDTEIAPEIFSAMAEELGQTPGTIDDEASPAPDDLPFKRQSKRRASSSDDNPRELRRLRADSEPVDDEDGFPSSSRRRRQDNQASKRFQNVIGMLHSQISAHRNGTIFHSPIKNSEAPDYHEIVKRPMDLKTIKSRIKDGVISNSQEFQRDIYLMFANAMMYNRPGSDVYNMTEDMMLESEGYIQTFRQTEGFVRGSKR